MRNGEESYELRGDIFTSDDTDGRGFFREENEGNERFLDMNLTNYHEQDLPRRHGGHGERREVFRIWILDYFKPRIGAD